MKEISAALIKFQSMVINPKKDGNNPHFKSDYLTLDGLLEAVKKPLIDSDLFMTQLFSSNESGMFLVTKLIHISGESIESSIPINPDKGNVQGFGAAVTYLRRYSLEAICGICGEKDDDGNKAVNSNYQQRPNASIKGHQGGVDFDDSASEKQTKMLMWLLNDKYNKQIPAEILKAVGFLNKQKASEKIEALKKELGK